MNGNSGVLGSNKHRLYNATNGNFASIYNNATGTGNVLSFGTNSLDQMVLDISGNLGIGATPVTWGTSKALQIGAAGAFSGQTGAKTAEVTSNAYLNSGWKYLTSGDKATLYYQYDGAHTFNAAATTGSAGNAITWDAGTTINPYGVGIGGATTVSGIGIKFPSNQVASSDANTLDDYEEGVWTPAVIASSGSATYNGRFGTYVKIGRQVTINFWIYGSNKGTLSGGTCAISGLPFASSSATEVRASTMFRTNSISITGVLGGWISAGASSINLDAHSNGGATGLSPASLPASSFEIGGFITYVID